MIPIMIAIYTLVLVLGGLQLLYTRRKKINLAEKNGTLLLALGASGIISLAILHFI